MEIVYGILGLLIFLFFWAGSGHLIWKIGHFFLVPQSQLLELSRKPKVTIPDPETDLKSAQRLLEYSVFREWIEPSQRQMLVDLLAKLKDRLGTPIVASPTKVAPTEKGIEPSRTNWEGPEVVSEWKSVSKPSLPTPPVIKPEPARPQVHALQVHALDVDYSDEKQVDPAPKNRERLKTNLLQSFMERSNIRWIELVSAALIVVCSVGLVISLWSTLSKTNRFFPSVVFMLATVAVHAAGQYTLKQWKLRSTSRGILHIALMLIPLSVLVSILLVRREGEPPVFTFTVGAMIVVGLVVYGSLAKTASRSLSGGGTHTNCF